MKVKDFEILISSPCDREKLVAEIWYENHYLAEINQEKDFLEIVFYYGGQKDLNFPLEMLQEVLEKAKVLLMGK